MPAIDFPSKPARKLTAQTEIWLAKSSVVAGIKTMFGYDPSRDHAESVATIALD
jgi:hypothetical protein